MGSRHIGRRQLRLNIRGDEILAACAKSNNDNHISDDNDDTEGKQNDTDHDLLRFAETETVGILGL